MTPDRHASIAMVIVREHDEEFVAYAESRRSPGNLLRGLRKGQTDSAHSLKRGLHPGRTEDRLHKRSNRNPGSIADGRLRGRAHLLIDQHKKTSRPRNHFALKSKAIDRAADAMTAPPGTQCIGGDAPSISGVKRHFEGQTLVAFEQRGRELSSAQRHIKSCMILSSASRGGRVDSSIEYSG